MRILWHISLGKHSAQVFEFNMTIYFINIILDRIYDRRGRRGHGGAHIFPNYDF